MSLSVCSKVSLPFHRSNMLVLLIYAVAALYTLQINPPFITKATTVGLDFFRSTLRMGYVGSYESKQRHVLAQ